MKNILRDRFGKPSIAYEKFTRWACTGYQLYRAYYYDCLPYLPPVPTEEDKNMLRKQESFFKALNSLEHFNVREGRLECRGTRTDGTKIYVQKRVDLQMGLDIAYLATKNLIRVVALVTGDSDFIPAVRMAKEQGAIVRLVHGPPDTFHQALWQECDERMEINEEVINSILKE